jgi:hypothetical protein
MSIIGVYGFASKIFPYTKIGEFIFRRKGQTQFVESSDEALNLLPGEWVEVKTAKEIFSTLDQRAKLRGLGFNPEMEKFCGKRFQVYKRVDKIVMESTGELRKIKMPTVLLKEVFCDGKAHGGCDRSCFCYWREAWLRRAPTGQLNQGR